MKTIIFAAITMACQSQRLRLFSFSKIKDKSCEGSTSIFTKTLFGTTAVSSLLLIILFTSAFVIICGALLCTAVRCFMSRSCVLSFSNTSLFRFSLVPSFFNFAAIMTVTLKPSCCKSINVSAFIFGPTSVSGLSRQIQRVFHPVRFLGAV